MPQATALLCIQHENRSSLFRLIATPYSNLWWSLVLTHSRLLSNSNGTWSDGEENSAPNACQPQNVALFCLLWAYERLVSVFCIRHFSFNTISTCSLLLFKILIWGIFLFAWFRCIFRHEPNLHSIFACKSTSKNLQWFYQCSSKSCR